MKKDKLKIIYEDKNIIVIDKPSHILTIANEYEKINTLYHKVHDYLYKKNKHNKVYIVHRLDYDTSGLIIFAKNIPTKNYLQENFSKFIREYTAIVYGKMPNKNDTLKVYLKTDKFNNVFVSQNKKDIEAITKYEVIDTSKNYSILKINLITGKRNQIRATLAGIGNPIVGDKKYLKKEHERYLLLHASKLIINYPTLNDKMEFISSLPKYFNQKK